MALKVIKKINVGEHVFEEIKSAISSGEWPPGTKIPSENQLAASMGVSRISIHGAIQKLSSLGILESRQGEGTFVCLLDGSQFMNSLLPMVTIGNIDMQYMLEFRDVIESECAALAAKRGDSEQLELLKENYNLLINHDNTLEEGVELDYEFHFEVAKMSRNPFLIQVMNIMRDLILESMLDIKSKVRANNAEYYHRALIEAIENGEEDTARRIMKEHLERTKSDIL